MTIARRAWSDHAESVLIPALGEDRDEIRAMVEQGAAQLWEFDGALWMVSRLEGPELVVMCMAGAGVRRFAPLIVAAAKRARCQSIRFHTQRPALARLLSGYGFRERERVFAMEI